MFLFNEAMEIAILYIIEMTRVSYDVCFLGLPDLRWQFLLKWLSKYDLVVYGHRWEHRTKTMLMVYNSQSYGFQTLESSHE